MGATRTERAEDPGGCGGEDRGLWDKGGRLSPLSRASRRGDSGLGRGDRSGSDRHGCSGDRRDKEGAYGQRVGLCCAARTLPRVGGTRVRPLSRTLRTVLYSPECVEGEFSEVRSQKAEKASGHTSEVPPVALALELVVILVVRCRPGNGSPFRSQHITAAPWVGRIEHQAL